MKVKGSLPVGYHHGKEKGPVGCTCSISVTVKAIFKHTSDWRNLGLVRSEEGESSRHSVVTHLGCEEQEGWFSGLG